jgi:effector-binding domain-containing protein
MEDILLSLENFQKETRNIYGVHIGRTTLRDSVLVSISKKTSAYPNPTLIYSLVDQLKKYISSQNAAPTNYPMLNVSGNKDTGYLAMVGLPTSRELPGNGTILTKRLRQFPDKILVAEVKGGQEHIDMAFDAITKYMEDNHLSAPAIPFQYLVTDRTKVTDPDKWITLVYFPIV